MSLTTENILLIGSVLLFISILVGKTSHKYGVPTLLLFLAVGMLAGTDGVGHIYFDNAGTAQFIGVVSLNIILFSGGLDTNWKTVKPIVKEGIALSTVGVILTAVTLGLFVFWLTDLTIYESLLLGSIVSSTDAAAVFSILRSRNIALKENLRPTLELESGSNDPTAYVLTIAFLGLVVNQDAGFFSVVPVFFKQMILGGIAGFVFGFLSKWVINRINLSFKGLYPVLVLSLLFFTFSATDFIGGNGFLAIYISGIYLGNQEFINKKNVFQMFDGLAWLMQIVLFLTLGLLVFPSKIIPVLGIGMAISGFLILVARPVAVLLTLLPFKMRFQRRLYISWVGLRGAVPIVFATYPLMAGLDHADMIFSIVFFVSVTSVLIQGTTLSVVAKWLKVAIPESEKKITPTDKIIINNNTPKEFLKEFQIHGENSFIGNKLIDLDLPTGSEIVLIKRGNKFLQPDGATVLESEDVLTLLSENEEDLKEVVQKLN